MKKTIGIAAHVDAGKTTFSEQLLLELGVLPVAGRVDHGDTLLDHHPLERERGITVFQDQAVISLQGDTVYWLDTPGHPDFAAEAERAMLAMDACVLLVSAAEGVQSHTRTLFRMLERSGVPVFFFLNKCDLSAADPEAAIASIRRELTPDVLDLRGWDGQRYSDALAEEIASRDDALLLRYLSGETLTDEALTASLASQIQARRAFPLMAGSALRGEGVAAFAHALLALTRTDYETRGREPLSGICYRVLHEEGQRYTYLKLTSGTLSLRDALPGTEQKVNALFAVHGGKRRAVQQASAGELVALAGPCAFRPGQSFGVNEASGFLNAPMMACDVLWDTKKTPAFRMLERLRELEEEDPTLSVEANGERLSLRVSGRLQLDVLSRLIRDRWGEEVSFGPARVLYRETITAPAVGIGHYEPLRHYAECWLRLVPGEPGSGLRFSSLCSVNDLPLHWQRLIETHVFEREHRGALIGAPLTDCRVELLCGRAHPKHTEGGDFRQAVYRAIRNALMQAPCAVLEPLVRLSVRVPEEQMGRVSASLARLDAQLDAPALSGGAAEIHGEARLARLIPWQEDFPALTRGLGHLTLSPYGYTPCEPQEQQRLIEAAGYDPLADPEHTPDSVFCAHGAGYAVAWNKVRDFAHCPPPPAAPPRG